MSRHLLVLCMYGSMLVYWYFYAVLKLVFYSVELVFQYVTSISGHSVAPLYIHTNACSMRNGLCVLVSGLG